MSHGESRTTSSIVGLKTGARPPGLGVDGLPPQPKTIRSDVELGRRLDDALGGAPADADDGVDRDAFGGVVEDALQQPAGLAGLRRAFAERRPLRHLDDAEDGQAAGPAVHQRGADADQLLGGQRVGDRDQDPDGSGGRVIGLPSPVAAPPRAPRGPAAAASVPAALPAAACRAAFAACASARPDTA